MRRALRFAQRNKILVAVTGLLMAGAGCVGAVRETGVQLTKDAMKPITVPIEEFGKAKDTIGNIKSRQDARYQEMEDVK